MTTKDEALKQALDALAVATTPLAEDRRLVLKAIAACREALAQKDEQEPVAWRFKERPDESRSAWHYVAKKKSVPHGVPYQSLYTALPGCQPLTDAGINEIADSMPGGLAGFMKGWGWQQFARAIEAAHGIGATHDKR